MHKARCDISFGLRQQILLLHQVLFEDRDAIEIDETTLVLRDRQINGLGGGIDAALHVFGLKLRLKKFGDAVFGFGVRLQNRVAIMGDEFAEAGILQADIINQSPIVEDIPLETGADCALQRTIFE